MHACSSWWARRLSGCSNVSTVGTLPLHSLVAADKLDLAITMSMVTLLFRQQLRRIRLASGIGSPLSRLPFTFTISSPGINRPSLKINIKYCWKNSWNRAGDLFHLFSFPQIVAHYWHMLFHRGRSMSSFKSLAFLQSHSLFKIATI